MEKWESLVGLASLAVRVDDGVKLLSNENLTPDQFKEVRDSINELQRIAPSYHPVIAARVKWFRCGLSSFEHLVVQPVVEHREGWEKRHLHVPEGLLMTWEMLCHFLTPEYLGTEGFAELHHRVDKALDLLIGATDGMFNALWSGRKERLLLLKMTGSERPSERV